MAETGTVFPPGYALTKDAVTLYIDSPYIKRNENVSRKMMRGLVVFVLDGYCSRFSSHV